MSNSSLGKDLLYKGIPAIFGISLAWISINIIKNEKKLLLRKLELQKELTEKSLKRR